MAATKSGHLSDLAVNVRSGPCRVRPLRVGIHQFECQVHCLLGGRGRPAEILM
jgi:hypothetical protein